MKKPKVLCLANKSFQKSFRNWEKFIKEILNYANSQLKKTNFKLFPKIKTWETEGIKKTYNAHLKELSQHIKKYDLIIGFTNKQLFWDRPHWCGISYGNLLIIAKYFPIKIQFLYRYGLKKLTLHEIGHFFGLSDSFFTKISIMDNFFGMFSSKFTKKQINTIKKFKLINT